MDNTPVKLGKTSTLTILRTVDFGCYLDGKELGDILLPIRYMPEGAKEEDEVEVFIYKDSEDRLIATTETPYIQVGEFAALEAKAVNRVGAFMDWGLMKDLFVPFIEQEYKMEAGKTYLVFAYVDTETQRIAASSKLDQFLPLTPPNYEQDQEVEIIIAGKSPLGYKALINKSHWGLIYENQVFERLKIGDKRNAYIAKLRDDDKIDINLYKTGGQHINDVSKKILKILKEEEFIGLHDKSDSEDIKMKFGISKKAFKKAIGGLYRKRIIMIEENGIRLL